MPYWRLYYHLVWSTKNREPALHGSVADQLERAIWQSAKQLELQIHALRVQPDHVHFAFSAPPRLSVAEITQRLKGSSSHYLGMQFVGDWPGWQTEYGVVGFGQQSLSRVVEYVDQQEKHHREKNLWLEFEKGLDTPPKTSVPQSTLVPDQSPNGTSDV